MIRKLARLGAGSAAGVVLGLLAAHIATQQIGTLHPRPAVTMAAPGKLGDFEAVRDMPSRQLVASAGE